MSLHTGKRVHGYKWEELTIDEHVIGRVESMVEQEKQPIMNRGMPCFEWTPGVVIEDMYETEEERELTIANRDMHEEIDRHPNLEDIEDET